MGNYYIVGFFILSLSSCPFLSSVGVTQAWSHCWTYIPPHIPLQTNLNIERTGVKYDSYLQTGNNNYCEYIE